MRETNAEAQDGWERLPRTLAAIERGSAAGLHIGAQLFVSRGGEVIGDAAVGEAAQGVPMTPATLMPWMSSTKAVSTVALLRLWDADAFDLDDRVTRFIPEFGQNGKEQVTIRHLLTHTGGFRDADGGATGRLGWPLPSWEAIIARICAAKIEPGWIPGKKAGYHPSSSFYVLGEIARRIDGRPFERFARETVFAPLGMNDCWLGMPAARYHAYGERLGVMQSTEGDAPAPAPVINTEAFVTHAMPAGSGRGPMRELGRFYEMLLGGGTLDGVRILSPQAVAALGARHRTGMKDATFGHVIDWGLGVIVNSEMYGGEAISYGYGRHASPRAFGHSGRQSSAGFCDPEFGLAVALVFNGQPGEARHQPRQHAVLSAIYEDLGLSWSDDYA